MFNEKAHSADSLNAGLVAKTGFGESAKGGGVFHVQCFDKDGVLKWEDQMHNLVERRFAGHEHQVLCW